MKRTIVMMMSALVLLSATAAVGQSLGDYAKSVRKNKPQTSESKHFDNDNLPTSESLSVVGPPASPTTGANQAQTNASVPDPSAKAEKQRAAQEMQQKIDEQKQKISSLNHELDLDQREYRLRAAAFYSDAGNRLRNSAQWDKEDAQYKSDMDSKQKAIDAAKQQLEELQEQARKAGVREKESDSDKDKDAPK